MIYEIINTFVYVILANMFYSIFMNSRCFHAKRTKVFLSIIWALSGIILTGLFPENLVARVIIALLSNLLFAVLIYDASVLKYVSVSVLFYVIVMSCDLLLVAIWKIIDPELKIESLMKSSISVYMGSISQLLQMMIVFSLKRILFRQKDTEFNSKMWVVYLVFPAYSLILIVLEGYSFSGPINRFQTNTFTFIAITLLMLNLFVYWFIRQEVERRLRAQKDLIEVSHAKEELKLYEQMARERSILGKREHEFKNIITVLLKLAKERKLDEVIRILDNQNVELINCDNVIETGNPIISAIVNSKYAEARVKKINVRFDMCDLSKVNLDERDSIIIFSNILNNAIESAERCAPDDRTILIKAIIEEAQFVFSVCNSCSDSNLDLKSRKRDIVTHGYGLNNVRDAVERNKGNCYFERMNDKFMSVVIFML